MTAMKYTEDHEWARLEDDGKITVGITDYAQSELGEIVFVELPAVGDDIESGAEVAVVESVKAAGEVKAPVGGQVVAVNTALNDDPALVNSDPLGDGWFYQIEPSDDADFDRLMASDAYDALVESLS